MLTAAGSGYSRWRDLAVTRWREDATCDDWGSYIFLRDVDERRGLVGRLPAERRRARRLRSRLQRGPRRVHAPRRHADDDAWRSLVSAEDDAEVRRVSISNTGSQRARDRGHLLCRARAGAAGRRHRPSGLLQAVRPDRISRRRRRLLATRRRRAPNEPEIWAAHLAVVDGEAVGKLEFETDRARFLGRGRSVRDADRRDRRPAAVEHGRHRARSDLRLRRRVRIAPGATVRIAFWTMVASSREALLDLVDKHRDATAFERAATLAWTQAQVQLRHLGIDAGRGRPVPAPGRTSALCRRRRCGRPPTTIVRGAGAQSGSGRMGISGDLPIVLLRIADTENLDVARQLLQAHEYWRMKQLAVDLVILNERASSYVQDLQIALETLVRTSQSRPQAGVERPPGRVFVLRADLISAETRALLAVGGAGGARRRSAGALSEQLDRAAGCAERRPRPRPKRAPSLVPPAKRRAVIAELEFFNGLGGFADDGREYVTILGPGQSTPAPWINVVANPALRLSGRDRRRRLHLVGQQPREPAHALVERSGHRSSGRGVLSARRRDRRAVEPDGSADPRRRGDLRRPPRPGLQPVRACGARDRARSAAIRAARRSDQDLAPDAAQHVAAARGSLSVTAYVEWVLGRLARPSRAVRHRPRSMPRPARCSRAIRWNIGLRLAGRLRRSWRAPDRLDRRPARIHRPQRHAREPRGACRADAALRHASARASIPAARCRRTIELPPGETVEVVFFLGQAASAEEARALIARYRAADLDAVLAEVDRLLGRRPRRGPGEDARPVDGHHAERLAALSDAGLPHLGALGLLSGERRLRLSRPASGRHGARRRRARHDARASAARGGPAVRRRRRPALVAAALRTGRAHADLRRSRLARLRDRPLCRRRPATAPSSTRCVPFLEGPRAGAGRARQLLPADDFRRSRARCSSTARARSITASRSAPTACR